MKKIHALVMSLIMLFTVLAPAQNVEAAGKSLKVSEKAFFKEMKEFDYKGMNRYVKDWGEGGQFVSAFYMVPSGKKCFVKAKNCWKVQKVSDKLADVMMANFTSNLQNLATFSISAACGEKSAYVIPETSVYKTVQKKVLVKVLKNIYGRKPELSA